METGSRGLDVRVMTKMLSWGLVDKIWYYLLHSFFFFFLPQVSVKIYEFSSQNTYEQS